MPGTRSGGTDNQHCRALLEGRYPSHVRELLATRFPVAMYEAGLAAGQPAFGPGGFLLTGDLAAGVTYKTSRRPDLCAESVLVRVLSPAGGWASPDLLEALADAAERYGEGLLHYTTGGTIEIYLPRANILPLVAALNDAGLDVGSTGDDLRGVTACCGPACCDFALIDSTGLATYLGERFMDEQQYPGFPHKVKTAVAGCPVDCIRAMTQKDHCFIGVKRGEERGVAWVAGGKLGLRGPEGAMAGLVLIPFIPLEGEEYTHIGDLFEKFLDVWSDHGAMKERIGDFIIRFGTENIRREMGLDPEGGR